MKAIDCSNKSVEVRLHIGDVVVWGGKTSYALATVLALWTDEIEAQLVADNQEQILVPLLDRDVDRIVGSLIEPKLRDLKKKGSPND